jgi:glycosyltransferase involved in cell wall biosynthesis
MEKPEGVRIGIVTQRVSFNDGQGRVNYEIAAEALRRGHDVVLFCEHADPEIVGHNHVRAELMPAPNWLPSRLLRDQLFAWRTQRRLYVAPANHAARDAQSCDAMLVNGFVTWAAADVNAVHFVHSSWQHSPHHPWRKQRSMHSMYGRLYNRLNAFLELAAFRRSRAIVAVSDKVRQELIAIGVPAAAITTIVNGVDAEEFYPGPGSRADFGLPLGPIVGLFAGDLKDSRKNLDTVMHALVNVPGFHLAIAGRHEGTPWPKLAADLGLSDRVHFLGFQRRMPELMRAVDLFVFPSRYEACSLVLLEALASGLPVVTARSAGGAELVTPQVGIVLDDSEDTAALAAALQSLMSSDERRQTMSHAARAQALQHSWEEMARRYLGLLEAAAQHHRNSNGYARGDVKVAGGVNGDGSVRGNVNVAGNVNLNGKSKS